MSEGIEKLRKALSDLHIALKNPQYGTVFSAYQAVGLASSIEVLEELLEAYDRAPKPDGDGFLSWNGGDCPVPDGTLVDAKFRDGTTEYGLPAGRRPEGRNNHKWLALFWGRFPSDPDGDIVAYRLARDPAPAAAFPTPDDTEGGTHD